MMPRRARTDGEPCAAEKPPVAVLVQPLEQVAGLIADKVAEKLAGAVADKLADAFVANVTSKLVDKIASSIAVKFAAQAQNKLSEQHTVETKTEPAPASPRETPPQTIDHDAHDVSTEAIIWVAAESPGQSPEQASVGDAEKIDKKANAEQALPEMAHKPEAASQLSADEDPGLSAGQDPRSAAGSKSRRPESQATPPRKRSRTADDPTTPRRNPKRAANEAAEYASGLAAALPDDLLTETLRPLSSQEIEAWQGWVEVESEPAFFNFIVKKLGVTGVTIKELLSLESWVLGLLPKPVFGLVFLFQYAPQLDDETDDGGDDAPVWFANQTTPNSCASVALLNIIMNAEHVALGEQLQAFKESTKDLSSPLRGHRIGASGFIRAAHNSFVRRMDMLEADLCLANEVDSAKPSRPHKTSAPRKGRKPAPAGSAKGTRSRPAATAPQDEFGFHFIAYVPAAGFVWQLDGMSSSPRKVGPITSDDWTEVAAPWIQQRIQEYGNSANGFSLLAMCRSPLDSQWNAIAAQMSAMDRLRSRFQHDAAFADLVAADEAASDVGGCRDQASLAELGLRRTDIAAAEPPDFIMERVARPDLNAHQAHGLYQQLVAGIKFATAKYREETIAVREEEDRVRERQKDYTPALHCWMTKLAQKGVLEDVIRTSH